jgi:SWI/SNF-related matrix-associated actin-dependent regulator of chromatin subfamily A3
VEEFWQMIWDWAKRYSTILSNLFNCRILSLIVADPKENGISLIPIDPAAKGTLLITPVSLLSNWTTQIDKHLLPDTLSYKVYHGSAVKSEESLDFDKFDVIITSYHTLLSEYKSRNLENKNNIPKQKRGFFGRKWRRIILDEAHTIRNPKSKISLSIVKLEAISRWSLTGIPLIMKLI